VQSLVARSRIGLSFSLSRDLERVESLVSYRRLLTATAYSSIYPYISFCFPKHDSGCLDF
jgi:hypothetical protein